MDTFHSPLSGGVAECAPPGSSGSDPLPGQIEIEYFTDPLCSWSWAMEPHWQRLRSELGERLQWCYRMAGMVADWSSYEDPLNSIHRPAQVGPQWYEVHHRTGAPIDARIWIEDPPHSSYPACIAVKAAEQQSRDLGDHFLFRVREAVMHRRRNIAGKNVLVEIAKELQDETDGVFDATRFEADLDAPAALEAFRNDLMLARYRAIGRFPSMILRVPNRPSQILVGYRPYEVLMEAISMK